MGLDELGRFISQIGIPAGFAFGLLLLIWQVIKLLGPYGRDLYAHHTSLVKTLELTLKEQSVNAEQQLSLLKQLADQTDNTIVLRKAAIQAATILERIAQRLELDVESETSVIRQQLMKWDS
jgi:hypothetical protein